MYNQWQALLVVLFTLISHAAASSRYYSFGPHSGSGIYKEPGCSVHQPPDPQACKWLGACILRHWRDKISIGFKKMASRQSILMYEGNPLHNLVATSDGSANGSSIPNEIPQYVLAYAPLVHLYSGEEFWPCDIAEHLRHVTPELNYTQIQSRSQNLDLTNLDELNEWERGRFVFLTSDDNVEKRPDWLRGGNNIPDLPRTKAAFETTRNKGQDGRRSMPELSSRSKSVNKAKTRLHTGKDATQDSLNEIERRQRAGRSDAPAVLIVVNKGGGKVDAFWFFFYSYNLGNKVFNVRFGNHVGDWEHTLVRFQDGKPKYVFFSEHNFGTAYSYRAVEKIGKRPVTYSATGTHAMYAMPGVHPYILPLGILHDITDRGPLWDPLLNSHTYTYDVHTDELRASNFTPNAPTQWFYFAGHWGDKVYPINDKRQYEFFGQYHYVTGPLGPRFKNLGRKKMCQGRYSDPCVIRNWIAPITARYWKGIGDGEIEGNFEN